jgi:hypothetical protein
MPERSRRLLQVVARPEILGGGVSCAWSICQALPEWQHTVWFCTSESIPAHTREALAGYRLHAAAVHTAAALREAAPDALLLHNTTATAFPPALLALLPERAPALYFWHGSYSALGDCAPLAAACRRQFAVSSYLAQRLAMPATAVWHQPVPAPPLLPVAPLPPLPPLSPLPPILAADGGQPRAAAVAAPGADVEEEAHGREPLVVGRLCNPRAENWPPEICDFYRGLAAGHPGVRWEFVGCPEALQAPLAAVCGGCGGCGGGATFHAASQAARSLLWRWDAMLYESAAVTHAYGRVVCEAQQAGCVPVVDARGGFIEQIEDRRTGFLCAAPEEFAAALAALAPLPARRAIAAAARLAGSARGSGERWRETFLAVLGELALRPPDSRARARRSPPPAG